MVNLHFQFKCSTCLTITTPFIMTISPTKYVMKLLLKILYCYLCILILILFFFQFPPIQSISFRKEHRHAILSFLEFLLTFSLVQRMNRSYGMNGFLQASLTHFRLVLLERHLQWWTIELEWHITFHRNLSLEDFNFFQKNIVI